MNSKGFTLIELLAVIVILAIIALIATPIVLGIINDSKESSNRVSATYIIDAVEQSYSMAYAVKQGAIPTVEEVRAYFNMDNATWEGNIIKTNDDSVSCEVVEVIGEFYVTCSRFQLKTITMSAVSQQNSG